MRNKKTWLIIKAVIILFFTAFIFAVPTDDVARKWWRIIMLSVFVISFIVDLIAYKKKNV